ncbi:MAG: methyltransferase [Pseudomonadota bacterium]
MRYPITTYDEKERARLSALAAETDPYTFYQLDRIGIKPDWQCLEVGAGLGTVSQWLADRLDDRGHMLCTDLQTTFIDEIDHPRIATERLDILEPPGHTEGFDLVVVRALYHHVPDRELMLRRLAAMLRPGGHLLIVEPDVHPIFSDPHPVWRRAWLAYFEWATRRGIDPYAGQRTPNQLADFGLKVISAEGETRLFNGGKGPNPARDLYGNTLHIILPELVAKGFLSEADGAEFDDLLDKPDAWLMSICFIATHAVKVEGAD